MPSRIGLISSLPTLHFVRFGTDLPLVQPPGGVAYSRETPARGGPHGAFSGVLFAATKDGWRSPWYAVAQKYYTVSVHVREGRNMPTTTIRLPEDLKARVARAAERAGTTSHAFILDAVAERVEEEERRNEFHDVAERRFSEIISSGRTIPWNEMRTYLEDRVAGKKSTRPAPRKLVR